MIVIVVHRNFANKRSKISSSITIMQKSPTSIRSQRHQHLQQQQPQHHHRLWQQQPIHTTTTAAVASIKARMQQLIIWEQLQLVIVNNNLHRKLPENSDVKSSCMMYLERCAPSEREKDLIHLDFFDMFYVLCGLMCVRASVRASNLRQFSFVLFLFAIS